MENQLIELGYTEPQIKTIKNTVALKATDDELFMFLSLAGKYKLDPFAREIWFVKYGEGEKAKTTIMTSRDGYLKIAQNNSDFLGLNSFVVHENDEFSIDPANGNVSHKMNFKSRGKIVGAWAKCERKGRNPVVCFVEFAEYKKPDKDNFGRTTVWGQYPSAMIQKVAEVFALKRQFGISGLVTTEEIGDKEEAAEIKVVEKPLPEPKKSELKITTEQAEIIANLWKEVLQTEDPAESEAVKSKTLLQLYKVDSTTKLTQQQAEDFIKRINSKIEHNKKKKEAETIKAAEEVFEAKAEPIEEVTTVEPVTGEVIEEKRSWKKNPPEKLAKEISKTEQTQIN